MIDLDLSRRRRWGHDAAAFLLALVLSSVLLLWAWDAIVVELLHGPPARFKHALALQAALAASVALLARVARAPRRRPTPSPR